jgi:hypothetical protein
VDDAAIIKLLTGLRAPDGSVVFERIERHTAAMHPNAGDVIAYASPRFALSNSEGDTFARTPNYGQHGGLNTHRDFDTTLGATGAAIPHVRIETMPQTDVAAIIRALMNVE